MFLDAEQRLAEFIRAKALVDGDTRPVKVEFERPTLESSPAARTGDAIVVGAYLFELDRALRLAAGAPAPVEVKLRYLVYVDADPATTRDVLDVLVRELTLTEAIDVKLGSEVSEIWSKLQLPLRPAVIAELIARHPRPARPTGIVRSLGLKLDPRRADRKVTIRGRVMNQDSLPVPGATVEIEALGRRTATDGRGNFTFEGAPETVLGETLVVEYDKHRIERRIEEGPMALEVPDR